MTRQRAYDVIRDEHQALAAMLQSLLQILTRSRKASQLPDFAVLRAMLFYIDEFPERLHHTKESELLFPMLRARAPELAEVLDRLDRDHASGERAIREVEHLLLGFEMLGEPRREAFENAMRLYASRYLEHMSLEEREVLPAARRALTDDDWAELNAAFDANRDPLTGHEAAEIYRPLFRRIVHSAPAPVGLG